jgi:tRNA pseudouridine38-40 synthase
VHGVLAEVLATACRTGVRLTVAGRTDAGVHATGQVAHADLPADVDPDRLVRKLARLLPADVRVRSVSPVPAAFDARFSALRRHYRYRVATAPHGAEPLRGPRHPRLAAPARPRRRERRLAAAARGARLRRVLPPARGRHHRPRAAGAGLDRRPGRRRDGRRRRRRLLPLHGAQPRRRAARRRSRPARPGLAAALLARRERASEVPVAPAHGLTLVGVDYPAPEHLAARATQTRRLRTAP